MSSVGFSSQSHGDIKAVLSMLQIETILLDDLVVEEGLVLEVSHGQEYGWEEFDDLNLILDCEDLELCSRRMSS